MLLSAALFLHVLAGLQINLGRGKNISDLIFPTNYIGLATLIVSGLQRRTAVRVEVTSA
jgi:hypothetical protein